MKNLVVACLVFYAVVAALFMASQWVEAREPVSARGVSQPAPVPWPCLGNGWHAGDHWGPGPQDIVPEAPPCPPESVPAPRPTEEAYVGHRLPDTDGDNGPAIVVGIIWGIAIIVIVISWYKLAYHDD